MDKTDSIQTLSALASGDTPVLEALVRMTVDTMEYCDLDPRSYFLVRIAGLAAMDASPYSYLLNVAVAADVLEPDDLRGLLIALAPVIGTARTTSAAANMLRAFASGMEMEQAVADLDRQMEAVKARSRQRAA
jgi:4-carboxymuconolactone decarboxylase